MRIVEMAAIDFSESVLFPMDIMLPMKIVNSLNLSLRKYRIDSAEQKMPVEIIDWLRSEQKYKKLFK